MEFSEDGMKMFVAGSDNEGTEFFSGIGDDEKVNEGNGRGTFKDWVSAIVDGGMGCWTELAWREASVVVKV